MTGISLFPRLAAFHFHKKNGKIIILLGFPALNLLFAAAVSIINVFKIRLKQQVENRIS